MSASGTETPPQPPEAPADPLALATAFVQLYLEVESGRRPRATIAGLMTPRLAARLATVWVRPGPMRQPGAARGNFLGPDVFEAVVATWGGGRPGAVAVRLERRPGGWRVTNAVRPEDGELPEPEGLSGGPSVFDLVRLWLGEEVEPLEDPDEAPVRMAVGL